MFSLFRYSKSMLEVQSLSLHFPNWAIRSFVGCPISVFFHSNPFKETFMAPVYSFPPIAQGEPPPKPSEITVFAGRPSSSTPLTLTASKISPRTDYSIFTALNMLHRWLMLFEQSSGSSLAESLGGTTPPTKKSSVARTQYLSSAGAGYRSIP